MKNLKTWNGRWYENNQFCHANVCAFSRADARRVIATYKGTYISDRELRDYWAPCWGNSMIGIMPERGLWLETTCGISKPVRVA